jgi:glucosamine--fructose-6-phosphate aminotransferase (isomerizing)
MTHHMDSPVLHAPARDLFLREILEQPEAMRQAARRVATQLPDLANVRAAALAAPGQLVLSGMGSSFDAASALASCLGREGVAARCINSAELLHFQLAAVARGATVIIVSQSGLSAEAVRLASALHARGDVTIVSVTNGRQNDVANYATIRLDMAAGTEEGPSTKTFAATMVIMEVLRVALGADTLEPTIATTLQAAEHAADALERALQEPEKRAAAMAHWWADAPLLAVVGRGAGLAAAEVAALVLKEAAHIPAIALDSAEFRHGPMEMVGPALAVVVVDVESRTANLESRLAKDLTRAGSPLLVIGDRTTDGDLQPTADDMVGRPLLDVAVATAPLFLLAWQLSTRTALGPGAFHVGSKTTTEE